jgi:signal transduction histidine kinase
MLKLTPQLQRYGVAFLAVVVAFLLTQMLWWLIQPTLYPLFLAAVMVSSWYGGIGPGLLATVLAAWLCSYFFIPSISFQAASLSNVIGLFQFVLVALLITFLNTMLRSTQRRAEINALEAQRNYQRLVQSQEILRQSEEEREQLLAREQAARAEAEAANRSKDEFLAILSHELRTPMTAIIGWSGMLNAGKLDETRAALALETIERHANLQMQLIEDLIDISRIIQGKLSLNFGLVEPIQVITAALETVQPAADSKSIHIESILEPSAGSVWGDSDRLQQVIWNLLSNAIKFTPEKGRVEVRLSIEGEWRDSSFPLASCPVPLACVQVSDTGKGISPDFLPYVFERFRQADSTSQRLYKGLGLGLAIARHLVELHGGTIQAESHGEGRGATFTVKIPLLERAGGGREVGRSGDGETGFLISGTSSPIISSPYHPISLSPHRLSLIGLRVLVVDDEADTLELLRTVLEEGGAEVTAVGSVDQALELLEHSKPDVVVSDIAMPGKDGYVLMCKVKELEVSLKTRIPAIALTAYARDEERRQALLAGFQIHLTKPVKSTELIAAVASIAKSRK